jgi:hypothetical protein
MGNSYQRPPSDKSKTAKKKPGTEAARPQDAQQLVGNANVRDAVEAQANEKAPETARSGLKLPVPLENAPDEKKSELLAAAIAEPEVVEEAVKEAPEKAVVEPKVEAAKEAVAEVVAPAVPVAEAKPEEAATKPLKPVLSKRPSKKAGRAKPTAKSKRA